MTERTWFLPDARERLTRKQIAEIYLRQDGRCPACNQKLHMKGHTVVGIDEHVIPLSMGGSNDLSNRELWCKLCASGKTSQEAIERGKSLRVRDRHIGAKMAQQPFPGSRASKFKKKFNGQVVER